MSNSSSNASSSQTGNDSFYSSWDLGLVGSISQEPFKIFLHSSDPYTKDKNRRSAEFTSKQSKDELFVYGHNRFADAGSWYELHKDNPDYANHWIAISEAGSLIASHLSMRRLLELLDEQSISYDTVVIIHVATSHDRGSSSW